MEIGSSGVGILLGDMGRIVSVIVALRALIKAVIIYCMVCGVCGVGLRGEWCGKRRKYCLHNRNLGSFDWNSGFD